MGDRHPAGFGTGPGAVHTGVFAAG